MITLVRTVAPTAYPVSLVEAKSHMNVFHTDTDAKIDQFIAAVTQRLDGWEGVLGRAIMPQTWIMYRDRFGCPIHGHHEDDDLGYGHRGQYFWFNDGPMEIPLPPNISVDLVQYVDDNDVAQTVVSSAYQLVVGGVMPASIRPIYGTSWPVAKYQPQAVRVTFTAGWPVGRIPETIKQAMLLTISHWYENREAFDPDELFELPLGAKILLDPLTVQKV